MDKTLLFDQMALLSSYITLSYEFQRAGQPVNEALLQEAEQMLRWLSAIVSIKTIPPPKHYN